MIIKIVKNIYINHIFLFGFRMKNIKKNKLEKIKKKLLSDSKTLIIAVEDFKYSPQIGYAPHIRLKESFYIFSSELSPHIKLLLKKGRGMFLIIQDENESNNIWARKRIKFKGKILTLERGSIGFNEICNYFEKIHGKTMALIKPFTDFKLIKITPIEGVLVTGFGNAYNLKGKSLIITEKVQN